MSRRTDPPRHDRAHGAPVIALVAAALVVGCVAVAATVVSPLNANDAIAAARRLRSVVDAPSAPFLALPAFVVAVTCGLPSTVLTAVTMLLFGIAEGALIAFVGVLGGGGVVFAIGRLAARTWVDRWLAGRPDRWFERLRVELANRGFVTVALLRLTPVPYALQNLAPRRGARPLWRLPRRDGARHPPVVRDRRGAGERRRSLDGLTPGARPRTRRRTATAAFAAPQDQ